MESPLKTLRRPRCSSENPVTAIFCYSCGHALSEKVIIEERRCLEESLQRQDVELGRMRYEFGVKLGFVLKGLELLGVKPELEELEKLEKSQQIDDYGEKKCSSSH